MSELRDKINFNLIFKTVLINLIFSAIGVFIFSLILYFTQCNIDYSVIFATMAVSFGNFCSAYYLGLKRKQKGIVNGLIVGFISWVVITLTGFIVDKGNVTVNTLFHLMIYILSSIIGGILGVNKKTKKKYK